MARDSGGTGRADLQGDSDRPAAILIAGPTASGKSALALALARALGGVVVNADSCQVYRELRILTARPTPDEEASVPHALYGYRPAVEPTSVAGWLSDLEPVLAAACAEGRIPVIVGGTGLYFRALTEGLAAVPDIPDDIRQHWRRRAVAEGAERLHEDLQRRDPAMAARLRPSDPQRLARALEVLDATGRSLADWQAEPPSPPVIAAEAALRLVIEPDRAWLHGRIDRRFEQMVAEGGLEEARRFAALDISPDLPAARAIGVRPLLEVVAGRTDLGSAIERGQAESRQYAKRQMTWLRGQMPDWRRIAVPAEVPGDVAQSITAALSR